MQRRSKKAVTTNSDDKMAQPRRSARFQNTCKVINYSESRRSKHETDKSDNEENFEMDKFMEELNNIEETLEEPTELFSNHDVDGKDLYQVNVKSIKKNAMIEKAKVSKKSQIIPDSPIKKDLRICLTKVNVNNKSDKRWNIKSNSVVNNNKTNKMKNMKKKYFESSSESDTNSDMNEDENSQNSIDEIENSQIEDSQNSINENKNSQTESSLNSITNDESSQNSMNVDKYSESSDDKKEKKSKRVPNKIVKNVSKKNVSIKNEKKSKCLPNQTVENVSRTLRPRINKAFHLKTDEYFTTQSEKSVTSNHTLSRLKNRHIDEKELQKLLADNSHISEEHKKQIEKINETLKMSYTEWFCLMQEGFTVMLYGLGSKRTLINNFRKEIIPDEPSLVINGFFPSLTIKEILDTIITDLLGLEPVTNPSECFDIIEKTMNAYKDESIYLLIHNLDGGMLRPNKVQDMLSRLACIPNVRILASVDHINAPLLWDNIKRMRYNFYWTEATTFLPYVAETSYESSLLVQKSGALALLSLENVFASLTSNAKAIYKVLVNYQIKNSGSHYPGMAFKDLYRASREEFLVSSDQALRAQLTEFIDHKLVKIKRQVDGVEYLIIPLDNALLNQFLEQQEEAE